MEIGCHVGGNFRHLSVRALDFDFNFTFNFSSAQGVVWHAGRDLSSGHYIASVRQPGEDGVKFCMMNDDAAPQYKQNAEVTELQKPGNYMSKFTPYVLFYIRYTYDVQAAS